MTALVLSGASLLATAPAAHASTAPGSAATVSAAASREALVPTSAARAATVSDAAAHTPVAPAPAPRMGSYAASRFAGSAARLPQGLDSAIRSDLGETPAQYLSDAAAAADGAQVTASLTARGVPVLGSRMSGTRLIVNVASASAVPAVDATGAEAEVGPPPPSTVPRVELHAATSTALVGGDAYGYQSGEDADICSVGFNGHADPGGASEFATAGHCMLGVNGSIAVQEIVESKPGLTAPVTFGATIGSTVASSFKFGNDVDTGLIQVTNSGLTTPPSYTTWGGGQGSPSSDQVQVTGETPGIVGAPICKSGARTGWTCGSVLAVDSVSELQDSSDTGTTYTVNTIVTSACVLPGDSGGPALIGTLAAATTTGTSSSASTCSGWTSDDESVLFPMLSSSGGASIASADGSSWELGVAVPTPVVSSPADGGGIFGGTSADLSGTVPGGSAGETVHVYLNGSTTPVDAAVGTGGAWSIPLTSARLGANTYTADATFGDYSTSATVSGSFGLAATPSVSRESGSDRYETAVAVAEKDFPGTAKTVFLATGTDFADALSAAPAAAAKHAPLLLTQPGGLPSEVEAELTSLAPKTVVVVGGTGAISNAVISELKALPSGPSVSRISGADRYATSRAVAAAEFGTAHGVFVATGLDYPDALSAGAAAGARDDPVILVPGTESSLDAATKAAISALTPSAIYVVGGTGVITAGLQSGLSLIAPTTRLAGSDRYATSIAVGQAMFASPTSTAYFASGADYPDALVGAAAAGSAGQALYLVQPTCIPGPVVGELGRLGVSGGILLGGTGALSSNVAELGVC